MSNPPKDERPSQTPGTLADGTERRTGDRLEVTWAVDCETEDTFLYATISNISELGIFVRTTEPLTVGTRLLLRFSPPTLRTFTLRGQVQWVNPIRALGDNPNPGMGIRFLELSLDDREQIVEAIRTFAYVRSRPSLPPSTSTSRSSPRPPSPEEAPPRPRGSSKPARPSP